MTDVRGVTKRLGHSLVPGRVSIDVAAGNTHEFPGSSGSSIVGFNLFGDGLRDRLGGGS